MIKEIEKPKNIYYEIYDDDKFYYDDNNNQYLMKDSNGTYYYFNKDLELCRENGPAVQYIESIFNLYYINARYLFKKEFANLTNHLICYSCNDFCKQNCF